MANSSVAVAQAAAAVQCMTMAEMTETLGALVAGVGDLLELLKGRNDVQKPVSSATAEPSIADQAAPANAAGALELEQLHRKLEIIASTIRQYRHDQSAISVAVFKQLTEVHQAIGNHDARYAKVDELDELRAAVNLHAEQIYSLEKRGQVHQAEPTGRAIIDQQARLTDKAIQERERGGAKTE